MPKTYINRGSPFGFEVVEGEYLAALAAQPKPPQFFLEDDPAVVESLLASGKASASRTMLDFASAVRQRVAKATHYLQATRWPVQLAAAQDVLTNGEAASALNKAMLDTEARLRERGETREQLAGKVLANSQAFTLVGACVDGIETATLDKIAAYAGADPEAFGAIVAQAKLDAHVELVAIFTPTLGEAQAEALVAQIVGA